MTKATVEKSFSTIGLNANIPQLGKMKLIKIAHDRMTDGKWNVYVESGHNLSMIKKCGLLKIKDEDIQNLFDDNDVEEFRNLAGLFGITV